MKPEVALEQLEAYAEQLKVRVSYEPLQASVVHGGLCRVKGEYRIIVDKRATAEERVTTVATALVQVRRAAAARGDAAAPEPSAKVRALLHQHDAGPSPSRSPSPVRRTAA
jgi:hypothetical protein